jgi:hypothetical protein
LKLETEEKQTIRAYLLGLVPDEEMSPLEERLMSDKAFYEELLIVEDELIDQYLEGDLSASERESFENHFLLTPERQRKVRFGRALNRYIATADPLPDNDAAAEEVSEGTRDVPKPPPKPWYSVFLPSQNPILSYSLATALVLIVAGVSWLALRSSTPREPGKVLAVTLTPGLTRGENSIKTISIPNEIGTLRLQLALTKNEYPKYRAILLSDEGSKLWIGEALRPELDGRLINVDVPAKLLKPGEYQLKLSGQIAANTFEDLDRYSFRVIQNSQVRQ